MGNEEGKRVEASSSLASESNLFVKTDENVVTATE